MAQIPFAEIGPETEIRKLSLHFRNGLIQILDSSDDWKRLMSEIREDCFDLEDENRKYTAEDIRTIKNTREPGESYTENFLEEWATSGERRPTLWIFLEYLQKANLIRAANYVRKNFPALQTVKRNEPSIESDLLDPETIPYEDLKKAADNFDRKMLLDEGTFASFYIVQWNGVFRVIKKFVDHRGEQLLKTELVVLSNGINHPKLMRPIGVSTDEIPCLIHPYMPHGSLKDRLAGTVRFTANPLSPLGWQTKIRICNDIIEGLCYLHMLPKPIVHRYLKSSNIFLNKNDVAHIGDFCLMHCEEYPTLELQIATDYTAPEAFDAKRISDKVDVYSYGVVLLDLLTGSLTFNKTEGLNLKEYLKETVRKGNGKLMKDLLDGEWPNEMVNRLCSIAIDCLKNEPENRPTSRQVKNFVENLLKDHEITRNI